jgi:chromosomal replication initiator protein
MTDLQKSKIILSEVCKYFQVDERELKTNCRTRRLTEPRNTHFYFCRRMTGLSLKDIAQPFKKDHSTVIHGENLIKNLVKFNGFGEKVLTIAANIDYQIKEARRIDRIKSNELLDADLDKWILSISQF